MELLKLSKFKLELQALATEVRDLREREQSAAEQCLVVVQKQKQTEDEYGRRLQELKAELASSNELRQKLERKVIYLQNDNALLEDKLKELKGRIQSLLQKRENFVNAYKESTCEMKRAIEMRDRKINILSEKINSHLLLFDSIEKEAFSIKQVVDNLQCVVSGKEEVVASLRRKMDNVSAVARGFVDKIRDLENKLKANEDEIRRKQSIISELEAQLDATKINIEHQIQIEELQKTLFAKDAVIQNLTSEKEALHCELGSLAMVLQKIKETITNMNEEEKRVFSAVLEHKEDCNMVMTVEDNRWILNGTGKALDLSQIPNDASKIKDVDQNGGELPPKNASNMDTAENQASSTGQEQDPVVSLRKENNQMNCSVSESPCSELQSANGASISINTGGVNCTMMIQLDSDCSTTKVETQKIQEEEDNGVNNS